MIVATIQSPSIPILYLPLQVAHVMSINPIASLMQHKYVEMYWIQFFLIRPKPDVARHPMMHLARAGTG